MGDGGGNGDRMRHHPTRARILALLAKQNGNTALTAGEIRARLPGKRLDLGRVRYHLCEMRKAGLVTCDNKDTEPRHRLTEREDE